MTSQTTPQTLDSFIRANHITMSAELTDSNPHMDDSRSMDHWRVTLRCAGRRMTLTFSQGYGHNGKAPKVADVLDCLSSDASSVRENDFESFAAEMGYDTDSRKALRTYNVCKRQADKLERMLGPDLFDTLLNNTERL